MGSDYHKRDLLFRLALEYENPNIKDLEKLFSTCYINNQSLLNEPEVELGILPYKYIEQYFNYTREELESLLQPLLYSGAGLVSAVKANITTAEFIYQKYRLFTAVDKMITKNMINHYRSNNDHYESILLELLNYSHTRRRKLNDTELEFQFWHFIEDYSLPGNQMSIIRRKSFDKCFSELTQIFKSTDGSAAVLKIIVDKFYEQIL